MKFLYLLAAVGCCAQTWTDLSATSQLINAAPQNCNNSGPSYCVGVIFDYNTNFHGMTDAWSGGVARTKLGSESLVIFGGGHDATWDNSVYSLNPVTGAVSALTRPSVPHASGSPVTTMNIACSSPNADGTPVSPHSYQNIVYLPKHDELWFFEQGRSQYIINFCSTGVIDRQTWTFAFSNSTWTSMSPSGFNVQSGSDSSFDSICALDPTTADETVLCAWGPGTINTLMRYDRTTNAWAILSSVGYFSFPTGATGAIDPVRKLFVLYGTAVFDGSGGTAATSIDISTGSYTTTDITSTLSGCPNILNPGLSWDSQTGNFKIYSGAGNTTYDFNPVTGLCTAVTASGGYGGSALTNGQWGRWANFPSLNKFANLTAVTGDSFTFQNQAGYLINGLGSSTYTCIDRDGDTYGVGPGCAGVDADDTDPSVHTGAQCVTKYTTLAGCIAHLGQDASNQPTWAKADQLAILAGYASPHAMFFLAPATASPAGNDSNACTVGAPCLTTTGLTNHSWGTAGDMVIMRDGWNGRFDMSSFPNSSSKASVVMSYPGEQAVMDASGAFPTSLFGYDDVSYLVIDGIKVTGGSGFTGNSTTGTTPLLNKVILRNIDGSGPGVGSGNAPIQSFQGLSYYTVEYSVLHDDYPGGQHGLYIGSRSIASDHVTIRRNIMYQNNFSGMHWNGRCTVCTITQNITYSNRISGISIQEGFKNGFVTSNLSFNNLSQALEMSNYDGAGVCSPQAANATCPYDQTGNLFENNTFYSTGKDWLGEDGSGNPTGIQIGYQGTCTTMQCTTTSFGSNTFRNNIIAPWGNGNLVPAIMIQDNVGGAAFCGTGCQAWVNSDVFNGNLSYQTDALGGTGMFRFGTVYTCAAAISAAYPVTGLCSVANPVFTAASTSFYNSTNSFNFHLATGSPAIHTGTSTAVPVFDGTGVPFLVTPSVGSLESIGATTPSGSGISGKVTITGSAVIR